MRKVKTYSEEAHVELVKALLEIDLPDYIDILKEAKEKSPYSGWVYNKRTLDEYMSDTATSDSALRESCRKIALLEDLAKLGFLRRISGYAEGQNGAWRDTFYTVYCINDKGKEI